MDYIRLFMRKEKTYLVLCPMKWMNMEIGRKWK